jgi:IrrE N-terminal-like domain
MSLIDHKVPFRSEAFVAGVAMACWRLGTVPGSNLVNLNTILDELQAHGVESIVQIPGAKRKGRLKIEPIEDSLYEFPAYVKFTPTLTMCVQKGVWSRFQEGRSEERIIIAHEIGHIVLHNDEAKQFSRDKNLQIRFAGDEDSAEGQANTFTDHLLIPTHVAERIKDVERVAFACNVPQGFAFDRMSAVGRAKKILGVITGCEPCPVCGDFAVAENAGRRECKSCGHKI